MVSQLENGVLQGANPVLGVAPEGQSEAEAVRLWAFPLKITCSAVRESSSSTLNFRGARHTQPWALGPCRKGFLALFAKLNVL